MSRPSASKGVVFRCEGGPSVGWGHVVRCAAIADALAAMSVSSTFVTRPLEPSLARIVRDAGASTVALAEGDDERLVASEQLRRFERSALVLDSYSHGQEFLEACAGSARIVIDDLADRELRCDVIVNSSPAAHELDYTKWRASATLRGPAYAPLRREFRSPVRTDERDEPLVLVTLGGGALGDRVWSFVEALDALDEPMRIAALVGRDTARRSAGRVEVHSAIQEPAALLARAALALSSAGTTCFELAACGTPALLLVAAENQRVGAEAWRASGVFDVLGDLAAVEPRAAAERVRAALRDEAWRRERSARARSVVDGLGADRVAREIERRLR